ncbi:hypothetical protein AAG906_014314 [Vitis piasezkii]
MDRHVAVLGFPTHAANLFKLLRRLACAAPTTIFSLFNTARAHSTIFSAQHPHGIPNLRVYDVADGVPKDRVLSATHQERIVLFLKATPGNFRDAIEVAEAEIGKKISCLVRLLRFTHSPSTFILMLSGKRSELQVLPVGPFELSSPPPLILDASGCLPWLDNKKEASNTIHSYTSPVTKKESFIFQGDTYTPSSQGGFVLTGMELNSFIGNTEKIVQ